MWICKKCKEESEDNFESCWNCSTPRDGSPSVAPDSECSSPESEARPSLVPSPSQSSVASVRLFNIGVKLVIWRDGGDRCRGSTACGVSSNSARQATKEPPLPGSCTAINPATRIQGLRVTAGAGSGRQG